jgi:hypothetical protein
MNKTVKVENARIIFRNFSGKERKNNEEGERTFCVVLDDSTAKELSKSKWDVKWFNDVKQDDVSIPYLQVTINPNAFFPSVIIVEKDCRRIFNEDTVPMLDKIKIKSANVTMNGYSWVVGNHRGVKVYLEELIATIEESNEK